MKTAMTVALVALGMFVLSAGAVQAASCGGVGNTAIQCSCGDTVVLDRLLANDPVTSTGPGDFCPGDGLFVASGVTLDLGSKVIRGSGGSAGVTLGIGATVRSGKVREFSKGIVVAGSGAKVQSIQASVNGTGISVEAASALLADNLVTNNTGDGIVMLDAAVTSILSTNNVQHNGGIGINLATVSGTTLKKNVTRFNGNDGIQALAGGVCPAPVSGSHTFVENQSNDNNGDGFDITAAGNSFVRNQANRNLGSNGIEVGSGGNAFVENTASNNVGDGINAPDGTNTDGGKNRGSSNGAIDCEIAGAPSI